MSSVVYNYICTSWLDHFLQCETHSGGCPVRVVCHMRQGRHQDVVLGTPATDPIEAVRIIIATALIP